jgi:hypothetical protein
MTDVIKNLGMRFIQIGIVLALLTGCVTTNYYTGQTLEEGETVLTPGIDNLLWITEDDGVVEKNLAFSISFGVAAGLPWRLETGIRGYFPYTYEANVRHQINPRSFDWFDLSANFHAGVTFTEKFEDLSPPYYKYGFTLSKEIKNFQPFISYYWNKSYLVEKDSDDFSDYSIICFGLAIPFRHDLIIPECNYYTNHDGGRGFFTIGIGLRAFLNRSESDK